MYVFIQLNGVNYPIQMLMVYYLVISDTQPEIDKLRPISQSNMQVSFLLVFFIYSAKVDFPVFFLPNINNDWFDCNNLGSTLENGAIV